MANESLKQRKVVIKLGGSLLSQPRLKDRFESWFAKLKESTPSADFILVIGGGAPVEGLRKIDQANQIDEQLCHWLAIEQMDRNSQIVASLLTDWTLANQIEANSKETRGRQSIFLPYKFLKEEEPQLPGQRLPMGWETTSDAIAARIAACYKAEFILLKSAELPAGILENDWQALAEVGYVDPILPNLFVDVVTQRVEKLP